MRSARLGSILAATVASTAAACFGSALDTSTPPTSSSSSSGMSSSSSSGQLTQPVEPETPPVVVPGFTPTEVNDAMTLFPKLTLQDFDGAVLREAHSEGLAPAECGTDKPDPRNLREARNGDPCKGAVEAECARTLACLYEKTGFARPSGGSFVASTHYYFVFGKAGAVAPVTSRSDLVVKLGSIDSAEKAMLLVLLEAKLGERILGYRAATGGGWDLQLRGGGGCTGSPLFDQILNVAVDGAVKELEKNSAKELPGGCVEGRRPIGLVDCPRGGLERGVAAYLAEAAHLEAAAAVAFAQMATTLRAFGAPARFIRAAEAARRDEVRHARTMSRLARDFGVEPRPVQVEPTGPIDLEALAIDNAIEGCVRETYSVARALWQARYAAEPRIRAAFTVLARDESRHAELSWALAEWLETKLDTAALARVEAGRSRAVADLRSELLAVPHPDVVRLAGMPDTAAGLRLFDELFERLELQRAA